MSERRPFNTEAARREILQIQMKTASLGAQGVRGLTEIIALTIKYPNHLEDISTRYRTTAALMDLGIPINFIGDPVSPLDEAQQLAVDRQIASFDRYLRETTDARMTMIEASGGVRLSDRVTEFIEAGEK
jgi:hypothetical protein